MVRLAVVIMATPNDKLKKEGSSIHLKKNDIFHQLYILINSIHKYFKIEYEIIIFTTIPYNPWQKYILEHILRTKIQIVKSDNPSIHFYCRSKCFTEPIGNFTHRLCLDCDMFFCNTFALDFSKDICMTYMHKVLRPKQYFQLLINQFKLPQISLKNVNRYRNQLIQYQYERGKTKLFPYFNGGAVLVKEELSKTFGLKNLEIYNSNFTHKKINRGMILQDCWGLIVSQWNWGELPIGFNYYGKWQNILDTNRYREQVSLIHYLGNTDIEDYREYYDLGLEISRKCVIGNDLMFYICSFKELFWQYGMDSQLKFFKEKMRSNDRHYLIYHFDKIIGYICVRPRRFNYIDTVLVHNNYRGFGYGGKLMKWIMEDIDGKKILLCKKDKIGFYAKYGFILQKKIKFRDKDISGLNVMSYGIKKGRVLNLKYY